MVTEKRLQGMIVDLCKEFKKIEDLKPENRKSLVDEETLREINQLEEKQELEHQIATRNQATSLLGTARSR